MATAEQPKKDSKPAGRGASRASVLAALDIGTTKVACLIAQLGEDGELQVVGVGHHRARGLRNGQIANLDEAESSVREAVGAAEQMANTRIEKVFVNVSCGAPRSRKVEAQLAVAGHQIREADVRRILDISAVEVDSPDREVIHCIPTGYSIDGGHGIVDPRGMYGQKLSVAIQLVTAGIGPVRNLATVIERCDLDPAARVVSPYAAGLACLVDDEKELGVTVIDMGGGTTSIAVFMDGQLMFVDSIPIGGNHVTADIAKGLSTPIAKAERLKTVYGSVVQTPADARELLKVPLVGEDDEVGASEVPKSMLVQIIQPRIEETFEHVRGCLEAGGFAKQAGRRVVLTGGASQLEGARDLAELVLDKQVRLARPRPIRGLPESVSGPAFAAAAGLLRFGLKEHVVRPVAGPHGATEKGRLGRLGQWLKENF
ncbi:MAG: cell division protein FtsA [Rhodospirillaceae bacterium]|nr:cell division protein FtsA [Rhodospirillaceae bacterium]